MQRRVQPRIKEILSHCYFNIEHLPNTVSVRSEQLYNLSHIKKC